jgi:hypothetical protein
MALPHKIYHKVMALIFFNLELFPDLFHIYHTDIFKDYRTPVLYSFLQFAAINHFLITRFWLNILGKNSIWIIVWQIMPLLMSLV